VIVIAHLSDIHIDGGRRSIERTRAVMDYLEDLPNPLLGVVSGHHPFGGLVPPGALDELSTSTVGKRTPQVPEVVVHLTHVRLKYERCVKSACSSVQMTRVDGTSLLPPRGFACRSPTCAM
jgi:hypothetical protein